MSMTIQWEETFFVTAIKVPCPSLCTQSNTKLSRAANVVAMVSSIM